MSDLNDVTELEDLKYTDIEMYLIKHYGSIHGGMEAFVKAKKEFDSPNISIDDYFKFLDIMIKIQTQDKDKL